MSAAGGQASDVILLHVYDLTRGLAAQLSPAFLGKLISVTHVYCFDRESIIAMGGGDRERGRGRGGKN